MPLNGSEGVVGPLKIPTQMHVEYVENVIKYTSRLRSLMFQGLTVARIEEENYNSYRNLSQIRASLVELRLAIKVFGTGVDRSKIAQLHRNGYSNADRYDFRNHS